MSAVRLNSYPTDEDLYISHSDSIPIVSYKDILNKGTSLKRETEHERIPSTLNSSTFVQDDETYEDGQLIPWRKLYSKNRIEESMLQSSLTSSRISKFLLKYNQWPIIILSSIMISSLSIILDWSSTWLNGIKYGYCTSSIFSVREQCSIDNWYSFNENLPHVISWVLNFAIIVLVSVSMALLSLRISKTDFWISKSGISELKLIISGHVNNQFLRPFLIIKKLISLVFVCACGGLLVGYEGPLIHISCGVINYIIEFFSKHLVIFKTLQNAAVKREIISIGFVIGISLAFGAPIGGLLFSVENLKLGTKINTLVWNGFVCSSIATFVFFKFHPFKKILINEAFTVGISNGWVLFETFPYLFVGLVCGLLSLLYNRLHLKIIKIKNNLKTSERMPQTMSSIIQNPYLEISALVIITHALLYPLKFSNLTLNNMLMSLFYDCSDNTQVYYDQFVCGSSNELFELLYYFVIIFFQSNYAYSLEIPGGILLPSLIMGALVGRVIGNFVQFIQKHSGSNIFLQCYKENQKCVSPGSYAIVGAASFFAGVTNTSVAAVVIVFELTGAVTYLIPLMFGVVVSKAIVDTVDSKGFYELWLMKINKTYLSSDISESLRLAQFSELPIGSALGNYEPRILYVDDVLSTVDDLLKKMESIYEDNNDSIANDGFVLLKNKYNPILVGWIGLNDLYKVLKMNFDAGQKLVSFSTSPTEVNNSNIVQLDSHIIPACELLTVSSQYSLLSTYQLMNRMLLTNIFICDENKEGLHFTGVLRIEDLSKLIKK